MTQPAILGAWVLGTDTNVGKTLVSAVLVRAWRTAYWKAIQTGIEQDDDSATVQHLAAPIQSFPPRYALERPVSPHLAAHYAGIQLHPNDFSLPRSPYPILVEGAGGLLVPLGYPYTLLDVVERLPLPVVLVARSSLGTINHSLLSVQALRDRGLNVHAVILSGHPNPENAQAIAEYGQVAVHSVTLLPQPATPADVAQAAQQLTLPPPWLAPESAQL